MPEDKKTPQEVIQLQKLYRLNPDRAFSQYQGLSDTDKSRIKLAMPVEFEKEFFAEMNRPTMEQGYVNPPGEGREREKQMMRFAEGKATPMDWWNLGEGLLTAVGGAAAQRTRQKQIKSMPDNMGDPGQKSSKSGTVDIPLHAIEVPFREPKTGGVLDKAIGDVRAAFKSFEQYRKPQVSSSDITVKQSLEDFYGEKAPDVIRRINKMNAATFAGGELTDTVLNAKVRINVVDADKVYNPFTGDPESRRHGDADFMAYGNPSDPDTTYRLTIYAKKGMPPLSRSEIETIINHELVHGQQQERRPVKQYTPVSNEAKKSETLEREKEYVGNMAEVEAFYNQPIVRFLERAIEKTGITGPIDERVATPILRHIYEGRTKPSEHPARRMYEQLKMELRRSLGSGRNVDDTMDGLLQEYINNPQSLKYLLRVGKAIDSRMKGKQQSA